MFPLDGDNVNETVSPVHFLDPSGGIVSMVHGLAVPFESSKLLEGTLDQDSSCYLSGAKHLLARNHFNAGCLWHFECFFLFCFSQYYSMRVLVSLSNLKFGLEFPRLLFDLQDFFFFTLQPFLMLLFLQ